MFVYMFEYKCVCVCMLVCMYARMSHHAILQNITQYHII